MIQVKFKVFSIGLLVWVLSLTVIHRPGYAQKPTKRNPVSDSVKLPSGGTSIIPDNATPLLKLEGVKGTTELKEVIVSGQPFTKSIRVQTNKRLPNEEDSRLVVNTTADFANADVIFVRLYARLVKTEDETGEGVLVLTLRPNDPAERVAAFMPKRFTFNEKWQLIDLPITARKGYKADMARFVIGVGGTQPQVIEIAGVQVLNYARKLEEQELPFTRKTYEGRDLNASWRKEAADRIEKYRKGNLDIQITDANGKPVQGATVEVKMQQHAFGFGTEINSEFFMKSKGTPEGEKYREGIKTFFNETVIGNGLKWPAWEVPSQQKNTLETVKWLNENNLKVRGHTLVWQGWKRLPKDVISLKDDPEALRKRVRDHIREEVPVLKGHLVDWDVMNESFGQKDLMAVLGREEMVEWFKLTRELDPEAKLYINENSVLTGKKLDFYIKEIQYLIDRKTPLDGIGEQGHMSPMSINEVWDNLNQLAQFNLPIKITEFDVVTPDEELQADWTRDFLTLIFSHPLTDGFVMWGFWDGQHWLNDAPIYYKDWSLKPSGKVWIDLTLKQWWSNLKGQSDTKGAFKDRGFLGSYKATVKLGNRTKTVKFDLPKEGKILKVVLD